MVFIGSDHAGYPLKQELLRHLKGASVEVTDVGCFDERPADYPDIARAVAEKVLAENAPGILICGTGIGISMTANKIPGIRCALCTNAYMARFSRMHNDANMLALGARVVGSGLAADIADAFLGTAFEGGRHTARVMKINALDATKE